MKLKIKFTLHYELHHRDVQKDLVAKVILTGKRRKIGKDLYQFLSRTKRKEIYVLCRFDEKDLTYYVINAKKKKR